MRNRWCELCEKKKAKMYCKSDEANLCWECDERVHSANFLVAKHLRILLCHSCQNHTPWMASGSNLAPSTLSLCLLCSNNNDNNNSNDNSNISGNGYSPYEEDIEDEDEEECYYCSSDEEEDAENQVVPWSPSPPPRRIAIAECSSSSGSGNSSGLKRMRGLDDSDLDVSNDEFESSSFQLGIGSGRVRTTREQGIGERDYQNLSVEDGSKSTTSLIDSIKRLQSSSTNGQQWGNRV